MPKKMNNINDKIKSLEDQEVNITFNDGCSMDLLITSITHLDEGDDFVAEIRRIRCDDKKHNHPPIGTAINIQSADIVDIKHNSI